jgi:poly(hydroxyalkanoate) granule-associated protein
MEGPIERILLASLGAISLTKEKAEKLVEELVKKGEVAQKDQPEFVKKLLERGKGTRAEVEKLIEKSMTNVLNRVNLPTKSDIDTLVKKIEGLGKKIK